MQVGNVGTDKISSAKRKRKVSDSSFLVSGSDGDAEANSVSQTKVNVSSLWQLQAYDDWAVDVDNMKENGERLLDELKNLRLCLINQELEKENIESLSQALKDTKIDLKYPELKQTLEDVRLRAEVELAKLQNFYKYY